MEAAVVRQLLDFFLDFLNLCQSENWPHNDTDEEEIRNAFISSHNLSECLNRLQSKDIFSDFFTALHSDCDVSNVFIKKCFNNPEKYILKKILTSNSKISVIDTGFRVFVRLYSEQKLEELLSGIILEVTSRETILNNSTMTLPQHTLVILQSNILLLQLNGNQHCKEIIIGLLEECNKSTLEILVVSLVNKDIKYKKAVNDIVNAFLHLMMQKTIACKKFWSVLFTLNQQYLLEVYLDHDEIFKVVTSAVLDCGKLLREQMSAEFFYIDLNYSQVVMVVKNISRNKNLENKFFDFIADRESDIEFWKNILS